MELYSTSQTSSGRPSRGPKPKYSWEADGANYDRISKNDLEYVRSGTLYIEPTDNSQGEETIASNFVWWRHWSMASTWFWWWDDVNELVETGSNSPDGLNALQWSQVNSSSTEDYYYFGFQPPEEGVNPFVNLDRSSVELKLEDNNPSLNDNAFDFFLKDGYEVTEVVDSDFDIYENSVSVPEASSTFGMVLIGGLAVAAAVKRHWFS
jgi:hypothetical protein